MTVGTGGGHILGVLEGVVRVVRLLGGVDARVSNVARGGKLALMGLVGHVVERVHVVGIGDVGLRVVDDMGGVDFGVDMRRFELVTCGPRHSWLNDGRVFLQRFPLRYFQKLFEVILFLFLLFLLYHFFFNVLINFHHMLKFLLCSLDLLNLFRVMSGAGALIFLNFSVFVGPKIRVGFLGQVYFWVWVGLSLEMRLLVLPVVLLICVVIFVCLILGLVSGRGRFIRVRNQVRWCWDPLFTALITEISIPR